MTDSSTSAAIAGATVSISGGPSTTTDSVGHYSIAGLAPATYSVTASAAGHVSATQSAAISAGATTTLNFALAPSGGGGGVPGQPAAPSVSVGPGKGLSATWSAPASNGGSPINGYRLRRYSGASCATLSTTFNLGNVLKYKDTSTTAGVSYCYAVAATNANGTGAESPKSTAVAPRK